MQISSNIEALLSCCAIASLNKPKVIPKILINLDALDLSKIREAFFKISTVIGLPKSINALQELHEYTSRLNIKLIDPRPFELLDGRILFDKVYARNSEKVLVKINQTYPLMTHLILNSYSSVLSQGGLLSEAETELAMIASLYVQGGAVLSQCKSHELGAVNCGATSEDVKNAIRIADSMLQSKL